MRNRLSAYASLLWLLSLALLLGACGQASEPEPMPDPAAIAARCETNPNACQWERV